MSTLRVYVTNRINDPNPKQVVVGSKFTGNQFIRIACLSLELSFSNSLIVRFFDKSNNIVLLDQNMELGIQGIENDTTVYILKPTDSFNIFNSNFNSSLNNANEFPTLNMESLNSLSYQPLSFYPTIYFKFLQLQ